MWLAVWLISLVLACESPAWARSDWVEEDITEFQIQPAPAHGNEPDSVQFPLKGNVSQSSKSQIDEYELEGAPLNKKPDLARNGQCLTATRAQHVDPAVFRQWLELGNPGLIGNVPHIQKSEIIEIRGKWDNAGHILHSFGLPYTQVNANELNEKSLQRCKVLIVNCGAHISTESQNLIRSFIAQGGYLVTTDWALNECVTPCFPGYVKWSGEYSQAGVLNDARTVTKDDTFIRAVISPARWKLEDKSELVQILSRKVKVIAASSTLAYISAGSGILAFSFPYESGQVLHLVGHFDNNSDFASTNILPDPSPRIIISLRQAIAANFIATALSESN
jgi:hypothetical protein